MTILGGCGHFGAPASLSIQLPRDCEALAANVPAPDYSVKDDPKLVVGEFEVALDQANTNLDGTRTCQANQRKRFAKGR